MEEGRERARENDEKPNSNSQNTFSRLNRNGPIKSCEKKKRNLGEQFSKEKKTQRIEKKAHAEHTYIQLTIHIWYSSGYYELHRTLRGIVVEMCMHARLLVVQATKPFSRQTNKGRALWLLLVFVRHRFFFLILLLICVGLMMKQFFFLYPNFVFIMHTLLYFHARATVANKQQSAYKQFGYEENSENESGWPLTLNI